MQPRLMPGLLSDERAFTLDDGTAVIVTLRPIDVGDPTLLVFDVEARAIDPSAADAAALTLDGPHGPQRVATTRTRHTIHLDAHTPGAPTLVELLAVRAADAAQRIPAIRGALQSMALLFPSPALATPPAA